jgi:hypothetical protein
VCVGSYGCVLSCQVMNIITPRGPGAGHAYAEVETPRRDD